VFAVPLVGIQELITFAALVVVFCVASFAARLPVGLALVVASLAGAAVGGYLHPLDDLIRHLVEGIFAYLDPILVIATATVFMHAIERSGLLGTLAHWLLKLFQRSPLLLLCVITLLIMFPAMVTGSSTAAVLTTGAMMSPVLRHLGIPAPKAGAIIALAALYGMVAPPVSIPALIIGAGVDLPFAGLDLPLLAMALPLAFGSTLFLGYAHARRGGSVAEADFPPSFLGAHGIRLFLPLIFVVALLIAERVVPGSWAPGLPVVFLAGAAIAWLTGERFQFLDTSRHALMGVLPVLGILMGVGMFIQVMTLTGVRGEVVVQTMQLPRGWFGLYPVMGLSLPLFGAVSSFGAASVLGVPFTLALPMDSVSIIINVAALVVIAGLGDLMPPTALASIFAARVVGLENYLPVLKWCAAPAVATVIVAIFFIDNASWLGPWLVRF
jgi:TRAP-type C4-dicarboxylate transport system permease large subunit